MSEIVIKGRHAKERVLVALAKEFPGRVPGVTIDHSQETKNMIHQEVLYDALEKGLTELEAEIDDLIKAKAKKPVDDWSDSDGGPLNLSSEDDGEDDDDDETDHGDEDDDNLDKRLAKATKFEAMVDKIAAERGLSKQEAMVVVRRDYPDIFAGYQDSANVAKSYRSLVEDEIRKGNSEVVARQKVAAAHPDVARSGIAKAQGSLAEFRAACDQEMAAKGCSRTEAMAKARRKNPAAFARYQNV